MADDTKKTVTLDGKKITEDDLRKKQEQAQAKKGVKIIKSGDSTYKTRIEG